MALPNNIDPTSPAGTDAAATGDDQIRALKRFIADVLGLPISPTSITAAPFAITAGGVVTILQGGLALKDFTATLGTITSNIPIFAGSATWNNGAVAFQGIGINVTNTASDPASLLEDLQVGGVTKFGVNLLGEVKFGVWKGTAVGAAFGGTGGDSSASTGVVSVSAGVWGFSAQLSALRGGTGIDTSGSTGVPSIAAGVWSVVSNVATDSSTTTFTNKTLDVEGTGNSLSLPVKIWIPAAGTNNVTASSAYDLPATNAPVATAYGTSPNKFGGLDHADGANALTSQFTVRLPSDWTVAGGIDITFIWFSASTSTNSAVWTCASKSIADTEDVLAPTFNTTQTVAKANNASANTRNSATITGVDTTGLAAGELAIFRVGRDPTNGSDTLAATAVLIGCELTYRRAM